MTDMIHKLELTDEEVDGLRELLKRVLDMRNVELHRTEAFAYKDLVKTRIELNEHILAKLEQVRPRKPE
jgi:hypothetical protein